MGKKVKQKKKAVFELEPDGFSIHTFELSRQLSKHEWKQLKDALYRQQEQSSQKGWIYKDKYDIHRCTLYAKHGIRIGLEHHNDGDVHTYFIRMVVNPRRLIDPKSSYLGILPPRKESIEKLRYAFQQLFHETPFDKDINSYKLSRLDLCTNISCNQNKIFRELVRVLRKLPTPPKYERKYYDIADKKEANKYNKHYLRLSCGTHELVIYDKTYQVLESNLVLDYETLPEGVLRFEVHCEREYLRRAEKQFDTNKTSDVLEKLMLESKARIQKHFSQCFLDVPFLQIEEIQRRIQKSSYGSKRKEAMLELTNRLCRKQSVDSALKDIKREGFDTEGILKCFEKIGASPIPLWKRFCAKEILGPVRLLQMISGGDVTVEYIKRMTRR